MKVTVARVWKDGEVTAFCSEEVVGAEMELEGFLHALLYEAEVQDQELYKRLIEASPKVLTKMKRETAKVVL